MMGGKYDDIMDLPHHQSNRRPHMPVAERAAQFMPFAALTGYDAAIAEAGRQTERFREMDESEKILLDDTLRRIRESEVRPEIVVERFVPDLVKEGGAYVETAGRFLKVDAAQRELLLEGGERIELDKIVKITIKGEGEGKLGRE